MDQPTPPSAPPPPPPSRRISLRTVAVSVVATVAGAAVLGTILQSGSYGAAARQGYGHAATDTATSTYMLESAPPSVMAAPEYAERVARDAARSAGGGGGIGGVGAAGAAFGTASGKVAVSQPQFQRNAAPPAPPQLPGSAAAQTPEPTVMPSMIIRTGQASVQVDSLEVAIAQVRQLATRLGGYVANSGVQTGYQQVRSATLELKLPANRFDEAVGGLGPVGKVESVNVSAQDVGEEFVDVSARVANARRLEERLIDLLARRTGKLEEVLQVERELSRVREEIERYEGRLRYLRTRSAVSTLTIVVHERAPVLQNPGRNPIADAFRDAWRNFVRFLSALISSLGVLIPAAAVVAVVVWLVRRLWPKPKS